MACRSPACPQRTALVLKHALKSDSVPEEVHNGVAFHERLTGGSLRTNGPGTPRRLFQPCRRSISETLLLRGLRCRRYWAQRPMMRSPTSG